MTPQADFAREQRRVALAMATAFVVTFVVLAGVVVADRTPPAPFVDRVRSALRSDLLVVVWLAAAIANVARLRFFSADDIAGSAGSGSAAVREAGAILTNTLEQVVLAVAAHLVLAASVARSAAPVTALACPFAIGRLLFWIGYRHGASGRAFGFALTFYPGVLALAASAIATLAG